MIVETSALVAILKAEPGWQRLRARIEQDPDAKMSAASYLEIAIIADRASSEYPGLGGKLDPLLDGLDVEVVAFTPAQARIARDAYRDYGKGSGHPAQLNFGDCFAYALAVDSGEPLLYKGVDFTHAGIRPALPD